MKFDTVDTLLNEYCAKYPIGAIAVGITDRSKLIHSYCNGELKYGERGKEVDEKSLFRIASISKIVTGLTLYRLVDQGLVDVHENVSCYIPWLDRSNGGMTLYKLLSHTAGLPVEYTPDGPRDEGLLESSLREELSRIDLSSIKENSDYLYSNVGIRLASLVMEKVTGERFTSLARRLVLEPLGMSDTTYFLSEAIKGELCYPCNIDDGKLVLCEKTWENAVRYAAGGLFSNINDLAKLARFIINERTDSGEEILSKESLLLIKSKIAKDPKNSSDYYGQTMMIKEREGFCLVGHSGSAVPYSTALFTSGDYGVALLMNTDRLALRLEIVQGIFERIFQSSR